MKLFEANRVLMTIFVLNNETQLFRRKIVHETPVMSKLAWRATLRAIFGKISLIKFYKMICFDHCD